MVLSLGSLGPSLARTPDQGSALGAGRGRRVVTSNNKYEGRDTAKFWRSGDPQINTTQSIPEGTPSSGGAYVKTETWPLR